MATFIALIDWTDQGVQNFKDSVSRYETAQNQMRSMGVEFKNIYWTLGAHDIRAWSKRPTIKRSQPLCSQSRARETSAQPRCAPSPPMR
ncbi:MAG TPA: GYD domain-containing protein [Solirubrobacteraceae bacterium]|jgi:hypothetical protein